MNFKSPLRLTVLLTLLYFSGCASNSGVRQMGGDTYIVTRQAATGFSGAGTLKADAIGEALRFCEAHGKVLKIVAVTEAQPPFILGNFPKAEVVFKALNVGDPELRQNVEFDASGTQIRASSEHVNRSEVKVVNSELTEDELFKKLERLKDLKDRGVLTEEEFQREKSRLLTDRK